MNFNFWNVPNEIYTLLGLLYLHEKRRKFTSMKIGYIRVSTLEQNTIRQELIMENLDVTELFIDKISGKSTDRPELKKMLNFVRKGDTVIVESISRFARNTKDLLELIETLNHKEVAFVSEKEKIDTTTPTGRFMLTIFGAVAELEREYILQRQREGIEAAKQNGKYKGRKKIEMNELNSVLDKVRNSQITATKAMKILNISKSTFYRRLNEK